MPPILSKSRIFLTAIALLWSPLSGWTTDNQSASDPFLPYLKDKAPEILRDIPDTGEPHEGVTVRRVVFLSRLAPTLTDPVPSGIFAIIATPKTPGKHPGMLVLHGGGGSAEVDKAIAWAQRGYIAVAPDLPGIADPKKLTNTTGWWKDLKYGEGRYMAKPDASGSVLFDAILSGIQSLHLLRAQPDVDPSRIGVVGASWGGYMTTMVCGLAGDKVRAGFAVFGCGFYEFTSQQPTLLKLPPEERATWMKYLDAGRRAPGIRAAFFTAGAANDFFFWPRAVQATLDAIPGEKNHLFAPNANHKTPLPGGTVFPKTAAEPFTPTPFQPFPTPSGSKANWLAMEVPYFDFYLKGTGKPLPVVTLLKSDNPLVPHFKISAPVPLTKVEVFWSAENPDWMKRVWISAPATKTADDTYNATLPAEAAQGAYWFVVASDERPVTVSSDLIQIPPPSTAAP
jgi:dienelactone hydrolase